MLGRQHNRTSRRRCWTILQLSGIGLLIAAAVTLGLGAGAGATGPSSGSTVSNAIQTIGTVAPNAPFDSGQVVNVVIPANSAFAQDAGVNLVECSAPDGVIPTLTTACDGLTLQNGALVAADGSFTFNGYSVYALPDSVSLGEGTSGPVCGDTAATECILYIGENQNDFTQPHLWSAPFFVRPDPTDSGMTDPGDGAGPAVAATVSATVSTAVASPTTATADGVDLSTVTVTLLDSAATPIAGKAVTLTPSSSTAKVTGPSPAVTDSNGQTTFTVTDTVAEPVTLTALDTTDTVTLSQKPIVTFQAPKVDASHSTVSANPTTVTAGNSTTITVTLRDQAANAQPVAGQTVTFGRDWECEHHAHGEPQCDECFRSRHLHRHRSKCRKSDLHGDRHDGGHRDRQHGIGDLRHAQRLGLSVHRHRDVARTARLERDDGGGHAPHGDEQPS